MDISPYISLNLHDELARIQIIFFEQFNTWLNSQLTNNQFLVAGVFTVLLSSFLYVLRNIPYSIWRFFSYRFALRVTIFNNNPNFYDIASELDKNTIHLFSRYKMMDANKLTIGLGNSLSWFRGRLVKVNRANEKSDSREFKQILSLTFPFISNKKLNKIFDDFAREKIKEKENKIGVYEISDNYLAFNKDTPKRMRDSVFLPDSVLNHIESRINFFLNNRTWYAKRGIPYKYAILLHGVPGTGKTTLAKYIASYTNRNLALIPPSKLAKITKYISENEINEFDNYELAALENKPVKKYVGLMEDIDCDDITNKRKSNKSNNLNTKSDDSYRKSKTTIFNLSDLLNSIDGLNAPEDFILVATTNHIDELDPALLRKGRFDDVIEIMPLETPEIIKMISVFRDISPDILKEKTFKPIPGSILQDLILQYIDKPLDEFISKLETKDE